MRDPSEKDHEQEYSRHCHSCRMTLPIDDFKVVKPGGRFYYSKFCKVCISRYNRSSGKKRKKKRR